jgi:phosphopantetheine adenylyltransferase
VVPGFFDPPHNGHWDGAVERVMHASVS